MSGSDDPQDQDSLPHLDGDELRGLVVALVRRLGGTVEFTDREIDTAQRDRPSVRILKHDVPDSRGRRFTVDLIQNVTVVGCDTEGES
jgi:hypothetical protein